MKTLIVEDDFIGSRVLECILSPYGCCDFALDGCAAIDKFVQAHENKEPYDLICLDIMIPKKDGHQVLTELRQFEEQRGIGEESCVKVIMTTALDDPKTIMRAFRAQCEEYLIKPIRKDRLLETVRGLGLIIY